MIRKSPSASELSASDALSAEAREQLSERRDTLFEALRIAGHDLAKRAAGRLMKYFPAMGETAAEVDEAAAIYADITQGEPAWAIGAALKVAVDSGAQYRPSPPKFLADVRSASQPFRTEMHEINEVLNAAVIKERPPTEREIMRKRILAEFAKLSASLVTHDETSPRAKSVEDHQRALADSFKAMRSHLPPSDALAKSMGLPTSGS